MPRLPSTFYNPISILGAGLAMFGAAAMLILYFLDAFGEHQNPYLGILIFLLFPGVLLFGLVLIPIGMSWENRRRSRGAVQPVVVDLGRPQHRNALLVFITGTSIFLLLSTLALYGGYEYSESVEFCGQVCHQVMEPEFVAYHNSPHARVKCVTCHIGPGADWYLRSKISGARQVFKAIRETYPTPIPTPIENLRPAREVCEQCHWPGKYFTATTKTYDYFLGDEENTHWQIVASLKVGGTSPRGEAQGSHWHISEANRMIYVASDEDRQEFDQVTWYRDGQPVVYTKTGQPLPTEVMAEKRARGEERVMDCLDCHNRPAHEYRSPVRTADALLSGRKVDPSFPWIKRRATEALSVEYFTDEGARDSLSSHLRALYAAEGRTVPDEIVNAVFAGYEQNFFPEMRVRWERYPDNSGHLEFPGCFRCHGSSLRTADGHRISDDCNLCHTIQAQGPVEAMDHATSSAGLEFLHPIEIDGAERQMHCTDCHAGDLGIYRATDPLRDRAEAFEGISNEPASVGNAR